MAEKEAKIASCGHLLQQYVRLKVLLDGLPKIFRYLLKIIGTGENVRLQYRSLRKIQASQDAEEGALSLPVQNNSS